MDHNRNSIITQFQQPDFNCQNYIEYLYTMDNLDLDHIQPDDTYYHEYVRLYLANVALTSQVKDLVEERNRLANRLSKYEEDEGYSSERHQERNKRFRRTAHEIQRFYKCTVGGCQKSYGSQGSLNQHYKLKHPQVYQNLPSVQISKPSLQQSNPNQQEPEQSISQQKAPKKPRTKKPQKQNN